jgi:hypothetical protein
MKQCQQCNKMDNINQIITTTDNKNMCRSCYVEAQQHYKKGLLNSKEIEEYYKLKEEYKEKLYEILLHIKKQGIDKEEDPIKILEEVKELEVSLAKTKYNKGRGFHKTTLDLTKETFKGEVNLTMREHKEIIETIMNNFDLIRPPLSKEIIIEQGDSNGNYNSYSKKNYFWRYIVA